MAILRVEFLLLALPSMVVAIHGAGTGVGSGFIAGWLGFALGLVLFGSTFQWNAQYGPSGELLKKTA